MTSSPKGREGFLKSDIKSTNYEEKIESTTLKLSSVY